MIPIAIILAIVLSGALGISLMSRQAAAVAAHRDRVPDGFAGWISAEEHRRAAAYTLARIKLAIAETVFDTALAVLWLIVFLGPLYALLGQFVAPGISRAVAVVAAFALLER
ncbi:MAG: M48 family peptidase, partial [Methylocella sp.]